MKLKQLFPVALAVSALVVLPGCGGSDPQDVMEKFTLATIEGDVEAAAECVIAEDVSMAKMIAKAAADASDKEREEAREEYEKEKDKLEVKIDGDKATFLVEGEEIPVSAVKVDGEWKLDLPGLF